MFAALVLLALVLVVARAARADLPPRGDSLEAHCNTKEQCPNGVYCSYAIRPGRVVPEPGKPAADDEPPVGEECRRDARAKGLEKRCSDGGATKGSELFCPKDETGTWSPPGSGSKGCGKCTVGTGLGEPAGTISGGLWGALSLLALGALVVARKARRRTCAEESCE